MLLQLKKKGVALAAAAMMALPAIARAQEAPQKDAPPTPMFTNEYVFDQTAIELLGLPPVTSRTTLEEHVTRLPPPVRAEMAKYLTDFRSMLEDGYRRFKFLEHIIGSEYDEMGLPRELAAGITITESAARHTAISRAGAEGLWQIMPYTGRKLGLKQNEAFDPAKATPAHRKYFTELMEKYDNDVLLSLAAYTQDRALLTVSCVTQKQTIFGAPKSACTQKRVCTRRAPSQ